MSEWYPKRTFGMLPAEAARRWGDAESLVCGGRRWTHREVAAEVDRVARALVAWGVRPGENVAVWMPNRPEFIFLLYGIIKAGAVMVPLNTRYKTLDMEYALRQSDSATLVTIDRSGPIEYGGMTREVLGAVEPLRGGQLRCGAFPLLRRVAVLGSCDLPGALGYEQMLALERDASDAEVAARAAAVDPDATALISYTSGTTGNPKGVMLSHTGIRLAESRAAVAGMTRHDVQLDYLPLFHLFALAYVVTQCAVTGAKHVLMETFDPKEALRLVEAERVTMLHGFDTHFHDLLAAKRETSYDLSSLRVATFATGLESSVPIALETQTELCRTVAGFGMTETWAGQTQTPLDATVDQRCRASGYALPGIELRIVDPETGRDVPDGEQGEIWVRSYSLMLGYYEKPEATAEALDADGWLHTGDAGIIRADGHLRFVGRYKDMLKVGGENASPAEIEFLILQLPGVSQVAVVAGPDARLGEVPVAFIVPHPGAAPSEEAVIGHCHGKIASFKVPRRVLFVDELPMTASGKVQKVKLRERLRETAARPERSPA